MGTPFSGRGRGWLFPGIVILILALCIGVVTAGSDLASYVGFFGVLLGLGTGAVLYRTRSAVLPVKERRAWRSIGVGLALMLLGVLAVGGISGIGVDLPSFGVLDVFFMGGYTAIIVGIYQLIRLDSGGQEWALTIVDALVGAIALAALVWNFVLHDLIDSVADATWWQTVIASIYPLFDMGVIIAILILVLRRSSYRLDMRLMFFAAGGVAQVIADFSFLRNGLGQDFAVAEPLWALNILASLFMVLSAAIVHRMPEKREFAEAPTPVWALMWPYLLAALLLGVHSTNYRQLNSGTDEVLLLDAVIAIAVVILFRQIYVIYRDRNRVERKRAELVASVSHELRTPLTAMVGFLTLLDDHPDEFPIDARQEMISEAAGQARHMARLVSDLLMLAKGDASHMSLEIQEVSAMGIVNSVLRNTDTAGIKVDQELDGEVLARLDPDRMKQALGNLLTNAVRYGGDRCLVVAKVDGTDLVFEIHDNGDGVPTRHESGIWQHFERGAHRLDAATPGLGIGLSIVKAVAESHGGRAEYRQSERLGGACFSLVIPGGVVAMEPGRARISAGT
ncbi:MAG TPA: HAMP domain-containing sensor histidine kinase [Acidimicrobiia bacterium]|nr:HAMP domain-containing sensor histidine kinase [Acidimicrobiia bacterium]